MPRAMAVAAATLLCWGGGPLAGQVSRGPLGLTEQNPIYQLFYLPTMEAADLVPEGQWSGHLAFDYSNIFEQGISPTHEIHLDLERLSTTFRVGYGLTSRIDVGARLTLQTTGGGVLDPVVEGLHEAFNLSNGSREEYPRGVHDVVFRERSGRVLFDTSPRTLAAEDLQLFGRFRVVGGPEEARILTLRATLKLPTATEGLGAKGTNGALTLLGRRSFERWHVHGLLGATRLDAPDLLAPLARSWGGFWGLTTERELGARISGLVQLMGTTRYLGGIGATELDKRPLIVGFGFAGGHRWRWQFAFVEDIPPNSPSVDLTVHFQISTVWD